MAVGLQWAFWVCRLKKWGHEQIPFETRLTLESADPFWILLNFLGPMWQVRFSSSWSDRATGRFIRVKFPCVKATLLMWMCSKASPWYDFSCAAVCAIGKRPTGRKGQDYPARIITQQVSKAKPNANKEIFPKHLDWKTENDRQGPKSSKCACIFVTHLQLKQVPTLSANIPIQDYLSI